MRNSPHTSNVPAVTAGLDLQSLNAMQEDTKSFFPLCCTRKDQQGLCGRSHHLPAIRVRHGCADSNVMYIHASMSMRLRIENAQVEAASYAHAQPKPHLNSYQWIKSIKIPDSIQSESVKSQVCGLGARPDSRV